MLTWALEVHSFTKLLLVTWAYTFSKEIVQIFQIKNVEWKDMLESEKKDGVWEMLTHRAIE